MILNESQKLYDFEDLLGLLIAFTITKIFENLKKRPTYSTPPYVVFSLSLNTPIFKHTNENILRRDKSNFNSELFCRNLESNLHYINSYFCNATPNSFDKLFTDFVVVIISTIEQHAPLKKILHKRGKLQAKPWIAKDILKSIQQKRKCIIAIFLMVTIKKSRFMRNMRTN